MKLITVFTPTRNKAKYLIEAWHSLWNQSLKDWHWMVVGNNPDISTLMTLADLSRHSPDLVTINLDSDMEHEHYAPAILMNRYFPKIQTKYFMFLADDDILEPAALELLVARLESNPTWDIVHGKCEIITEQPDGSYIHSGWMGGEADLGLGTGRGPDCVIDGGQILQTKRSYDSLKGWQIPTIRETCGHVDGIYMAELAKHFTFHFMDWKVLTHRRTRFSTHAYPDWVYRK